MNGQTCQRKGKVTASRRAKAKERAMARENIQKKGTTTRTRLDLRMKMDSARWVVEFVGAVQENAEFESHRLDLAACVFCFQKCNSVSMDPTELPSSSKRVSDGNGEPAGTHEKFDQSTGEVLFRRWVSR